MKRSIIVATSVLAALALAAPVGAAGPISGRTIVPPDPQATGTTISVEAVIEVADVIPVVPFEYAIQNECSLPNRGGRTIQRDDIVYWIDEAGGFPHTVMPIYLQSIPEGSKCKAFLMRGNVQVKGSVSSYVVDGP